MQPDPATMRVARQAMRHVRDGARVIVGSMAAEPRHLMLALEERAASLGSVDLWAGMLLSDYGFLATPSIRFTTWFPPGTVGRRRIPAGRIEHLPLSWAQVAEVLRERASSSIVMVQVAPADDEGFHSLSLSAGHIGVVIDNAEVILAEVNDDLPQTRGRRVHASRLTVAIPSRAAVPQFPTATYTEADLRIARSVAELLDSDITLQVGVGAVPDACLGELARQGFTDLRIHSGATNGVLELARAGALAQGPEVIRVGEVLGSRQLYDFVHDNPLVELVDARQTHYPDALLAIDRLYCVNSAISVDTFGQVNCEYVRGEHRGAVGGLADFAHAASWPGNRSVIALRSTTSGAAESRIVPRLEAATTSLSRDLTEFVVTEYGVADLRGATVRQRRKALAAVAHPRYRSSLE